MLSSDNTTMESTTDAERQPGNGSLDGISSIFDSTNQSLPQNYFYYDYEAFHAQFRFMLSLFLWQKLTAFLSVICIFGNVVILLVLSQKKSRNVSTSIFIMSLAVSDMLASLFLLEGFLLSNGFIVGTYSWIDCKLRLFLPRVGSYSSTIMLAIISIERAVSVKIPHKVKLIFTVKIARFLVAAVWLISFASACLASYVYTYTTGVGRQALCLIKAQTPAYWTQFAVSQTFSFVPWTVNVFCMVFIINALVRNAVVNNKSHKKQVESVTKTLLIVNIVYFLLVTPTVCFDTYAFVLVNFVKPIWSYMEYRNYFNVHNILTIFLYTNNVLNFFIYFLIGSRFRKETEKFFLSFKCCKECCKQTENRAEVKKVVNEEDSAGYL